MFLSLCTVSNWIYISNKYQNYKRTLSIMEYLTRTNWCLFRAISFVMEKEFHSRMHYKTIFSSVCKGAQHRRNKNVKGALLSHFLVGNRAHLSSIYSVVEARCVNKNECGKTDIKILN